MFCFCKTKQGEIGDEKTVRIEEFCCLKKKDKRTKEDEESITREENNTSTLLPERRKNVSQHLDVFENKTGVMGEEFLNLFFSCKQKRRAK